VDFVETQRVNIPILNKLLSSASGSSIRGGVAATKVSAHSRTPIIFVPTPVDVTDSNGASERTGTNGDDAV
jgi:hypothetical protein